MKGKMIWMMGMGLGLLMASFHVSTAADKPIELRFSTEMEIASLDPLKSTNNWEWVSVLNIYDTLIFPDPDPKVKFRPWIAIPGTLPRMARPIPSISRKA